MGANRRAQERERADARCHDWRSSSLLFVLDVSADDLRHIGVFFFLLLDDWALGVVLDGLVRLHVLGRLRVLALSLCVGFLERDQLGPLNLLGLDLWLARRRSFIEARSRGPGTTSNGVPHFGHAIGVLFRS